MKFWKRRGSVQVGNFRYALDGLKYSFKVEFAETPPGAEVQIYNLNADSRSRIRKGQPLIIAAGYGDQAGTLFVGEVIEVSHAPSGVDMITKIKGKDGASAWIGQSIQKTYAKNTDAREILDDLLDIFGMEIAGIELVHNARYPRGKVCSGKLPTVLKQIIEKDCKSRLLIRNGQVLINPPKKGVNTGALLTPETGLLQGIKINDKSESGGDTADVEIKTFLNYHIGMNDVVMVRCRELNGQYQVVGGSHSGSNTGEFITKLELNAR